MSVRIKGSPRAPEIVCQPDSRVRSKAKFPDYSISLIVDVIDTDRAKAMFLVAFVCFFCVAPKRILESGETECCFSLFIPHCNFSRWDGWSCCGKRSAVGRQRPNKVKQLRNRDYQEITCRWSANARRFSRRKITLETIILPRVTSKSMNCNTD